MTHTIFQIGSIPKQFTFGIKSFSSRSKKKKLSLQDNFKNTSRTTRHGDSITGGRITDGAHLGI